MDLASSDDRVVAIMKHPVSNRASFVSFLEGTASPAPQSWPIYVRENKLNPQSWPVYVREDLLDRSWNVGSYVKLGGSKFEAPLTTGKFHSKMKQI